MEAIIPPDENRLESLMALIRNAVSRIAKHGFGKCEITVLRAQGKLRFTIGYMTTENYIILDDARQE